MLDIKQLKYFLCCAEYGSFSEAARVLYSTQPSVSKVIKGLEDDMGIILFERMPRGIKLTSQGKKLYRHANQIMREMEELEKISAPKATKWLYVSLNPSSWFAEQFVDFYNKNYEKDYHCSIRTADVQTVFERVRDYKDDIGFIFLSEGQMQTFWHELRKGNLEFCPLRKVDRVIYLGEKHEDFDSGKIPDMKSLRFIQSYQNDFPEDFGEQLSMDVSIVTNSDYIMERMLKKTDLANISGKYLSSKRKGAEKGYVLPDNSAIIFGYLKRNKEELQDVAQELVDFIREALKNEN